MRRLQYLTTVFPAAAFLAATVGCGGSDARLQSGVKPVTPSCELPGDQDCAPAAAGSGKADAWDSVNDPRRIAHDLNYRLQQLPEKGHAEQDVWTASYWPTVRGSTNYRWNGADQLSPVEKYDQAVNGWRPDAADTFMTEVPQDCGEGAADYRTYRAWLGPAARWQSGAQGRTRMFDGVNNDPEDDETIDECGSERDGIESWWGLCHAWAPAALLVPEPLHAVTYKGVKFEVSDIKGLVMTAYDGVQSLGLGGRCNAREMERDDDNRVVADECRDVNPGAWHVVVSNLIGIKKQGFVEDRTGSFEVWNQPLIGYDVTKLEEVTIQRANELLNVDGATYAFNDDAVKFYEVRMTTDWLTEGHQSTEPLGSEGYVRHDHYHYILEVNAQGKVIGGEWLGRSRVAHPDFLWVPLRPNTGFGRRSNPHVDLAVVRKLVEMSRAELPQE